MRLRSIAGIVVALLFTLCGTTAQGATTPIDSTSPPAASVPAECHFGQCQAIAKSTGQQCKHCVSNKGDLYCWQHK